MPSEFIGSSSGRQFGGLVRLRHLLLRSGHEPHVISVGGPDESQVERHLLVVDGGDGSAVQNHLIEIGGAGFLRHFLVVLDVVAVGRVRQVQANCVADPRRSAVVGFRESDAVGGGGADEDAPRRQGRDGCLCACMAVPKCAGQAQVLAVLGLDDSVVDREFVPVEFDGGAQSVGRTSCP